MTDCKNMLHPFQNDPGVSQRQRIIHNLLSGDANIDGRSLADLLDFFVKLSRHVNFYESDLSVHDWQPFFKKSIPFTITGIIKYDVGSVEEKAAFYRTLLGKYPSPAGLQLIAHYMFYQVINRINTWYGHVQGSELPVAFTLESLIRDKLRSPMQKFIQYANAAVKWYCIKPFDWHRLEENEHWDLDMADVFAFDESFKIKGKTESARILALAADMIELLPAFLGVIRLSADAAVLSLEKSLIPLKAELQEKHPPHLALLFTFLKLFRYVQDDLNGYTKKHLDFFYKQVLRMQSRDAVPDQAHVVFELQNQLDQYRLRKGLLVKDGKDVNQAEILFSLDDEIVVNRAEVSDKRTLYLNNRTLFETTYVEGVYMAPNAEKADGVEKDFGEEGTGSFSTLGARQSKYADPEHRFNTPHPNARLGLILASPVLLLNEGHRTVTIRLNCELKPNICGEIGLVSGSSSGCCDEEGRTDDEASVPYPNFAPPADMYTAVEELLKKTFYYISRDLVAQAKKQGVSGVITDRLEEFITVRKTQCYCENEEGLYEATVPATTDESTGFEDIFTPDERDILADLFKPRKAVSVNFSGEKEWLAPDEPPDIVLTPPALPGDRKFTLTITSVLSAGRPSVTFYDGEQLKEEFNTTHPVAKIELDDKIKMERVITARPGACCLEREPEDAVQDISLYHFFRNAVLIEEEESPTNIAVKVCGLKNFVVQNDDSIQDVNAPVYPFGTRPEIIDFDVVNPREGASKNLIGPNFYIGSGEIFLKRWEQVCINLNWKNKPTNFNDYYKGYLVRDNFHTCDDPEDNTHEVYGLNECDFEVNVALLEGGLWSKELSTSSKVKQNDVTGDWNRPLFIAGACEAVCSQEQPFGHSFFVENTDFAGSRQFRDLHTEIDRYRTDSRAGFLRFNLQNQDFLHKDYSFVLARQMMAFGRYPNLVDGAVYVEGGVPQVFDISIFFGNIGPKVIEIAGNVVNSGIEDILDELIQIISDEIDSSASPALLNGIIEQCKLLLDQVVSLASLPSIPDLFSAPFDLSTLAASVQDDIKSNIKDFVLELFNLLKTNLTGIEDALKSKIREKFDELLADIDMDGFFTGLFNDKEVIIPNEPWTPILREISLDYTASAGMENMELIHLYPYHGTFKSEEIELKPALLPTFCDEGTLFLGLKNLVPGNNLHILFHLAEATADSESERETVYWHYLDNNDWKMLRPGFEVIDDATDGLTTSGIIKFALPANMTDENTVLPKELHWIRASIPQNSRTVSETIGIHAQAIRVTFTNEGANDKHRLSQALPAGSISKLREADASVKKINQPYASFGGRVPEAEGHFYVRVSERLRHKGRAIQKFDYERLVLEAFPQIYKVKCINHSFALDANRYFNDFQVAPGYVVIAVIPDLNRLKAATSMEPGVPVSLLEKVTDHISSRTSPFVRVRTTNPRYEMVDFCIRVKLHQGRDENYYREKLRQDLREFLAPWSVGEFDKLTFGQCIYRSDIVQFFEMRDYIDYLLELKMKHGEDSGAFGEPLEVCPLTPRSILISGNIDVCIQQRDCEEWQKCYNEQQEEDPCCDHEKIPVVDYCREKGIS